MALRETRGSAPAANAAAGQPVFRMGQRQHVSTACRSLRAVPPPEGSVPHDIRPRPPDDVRSSLQAPASACVLREKRCTRTSCGHDYFRHTLRPGQCSRSAGKKTDSSDSCQDVLFEIEIRILFPATPEAVSAKGEFCMNFEARRDNCRLKIAIITWGCHCIICNDIA